MWTAGLCPPRTGKRRRTPADIAQQKRPASEGGTRRTRSEERTKATWRTKTWKKAKTKRADCYWRSMESAGWWLGAGWLTAVEVGRGWRGLEGRSLFVFGMTRKRLQRTDTHSHRCRQCRVKMAAAIARWQPKLRCRRSDPGEGRSGPIEVDDTDDVCQSCVLLSACHCCFAAGSDKAGNVQLVCRIKQ